jgi:8-oxo-dGTP diphosphatase
MTDQPLYERDPAAYRAHLAEGNARQARKRVAAEVLIRNERGEILLVDPVYKPDWHIPGGMADANEPPHQAARRELREELGLDLSMGMLLCVEWVAPHGPWDDSLVFVFDGGVLTGRADNVRPRDDELRAARFCPDVQASHLLRPYAWRRIAAAITALESGAARYLVEEQLPES